MCPWLNAVRSRHLKVGSTEASGADTQHMAYVLKLAMAAKEAVLRHAKFAAAKAAAASSILHERSTDAKMKEIFEGPAPTRRAKLLSLLEGRLGERNSGKVSEFTQVPSKTTCIYV